MEQARRRVPDFAWPIVVRFSGRTVQFRLTETCSFVRTQVKQRLLETNCLDSVEFAQSAIEAHGWRGVRRVRFDRAPFRVLPCFALLEALSITSSIACGDVDLGIIAKHCPRLQSLTMGWNSMCDTFDWSLFRHLRKFKISSYLQGTRSARFLCWPPRIEELTGLQIAEGCTLPVGLRSCDIYVNASLLSQRLPATIERLCLISLLTEIPNNFESWQLPELQCLRVQTPSVWVSLPLLLHSETRAKITTFECSIQVPVEINSTILPAVRNLLLESPLTTFDKEIARRLVSLTRFHFVKSYVCFPANMVNLRNLSLCVTSGHALANWSVIRELPSLESCFCNDSAAVIPGECFLNPNLRKLVVLESLFNWETTIYACVPDSKTLGDFLARCRPNFEATTPWFCTRQ